MKVLHLVPLFFSLSAFSQLKIEYSEKTNVPEIKRQFSSRLQRTEAFLPKHISFSPSYKSKTNKWIRLEKRSRWQHKSQKTIPLGEETFDYLQCLKKQAQAEGLSLCVSPYNLRHFQSKKNQLTVKDAIWLEKEEIPFAKVEVVSKKEESNL